MAPAADDANWAWQILARILAEHDEAITVRRIAAGQGCLSPHRHLPRAGCSPKLLNAIGIEDGAVASRPVVSTTGKEGMRTFDPYVIGIKIVGLSQPNTVPLEPLQELLREGEVAIIWVEDVDVRGT